MYHIIEQPVQATALQIEVHIVLLQKDTTAHNSPAMTMTMNLTINDDEFYSHNHFTV